MKNKKGAADNGKLLTILMIVLVAVALFLGADRLGYIPAKQTGSVNNPGGSGSTGNVIATSTTLSLTGSDAQSPGTPVGVTSYVGVNGQPLSTGITSVGQGQELTILLTNTTPYHAAFADETVPGTTNFIKTVPMNKNATLSIAVYNTGKSAMTNGGGATNQTVATGGAYTMELDITGTSLASTQDMICVLEGSSTSVINKLQLNGFGATFLGSVKPASYSLASGTSGVWVYSVPPINDASLRIGSIYAESKQGQTMAGKYFKLACYTKEYFIDSSANSNTVNTFANLVGQPNVYYGIEDSAGTAKSMAAYTFTGYFQ